MSRAFMPRPKSQEWGTPAWLFDRLHREFGFTVDAAASDALHTLPRYWTRADDGLAQDWTSERVFVNPPFLVDDLRAWSRRAAQATEAEVVVMVLPVKADQDWWHRWVLPYATEVRFIRGRVWFTRVGEPATGAPGATAVAVWRGGGKRLHLGPAVSSIRRTR